MNEPVYSIYSHIAGAPGGDDELFITRQGGPGVAGAFLRYEICNYDPNTNSQFDRDWDPDDTVILFQDGPITADNRHNGITVEALLAVCADRLMGFQNGPLACEHNARALSAIESALWALHERTRDRKRRGVLGNAGTA